MFCQNKHTVQNLCTVSEIHVPYWKYMYPNGNIYTLLGIHVRYWKYMYPIGNICTTMEICVPYWKIPAFGTLPVEP